MAIITSIGVGLSADGQVWIGSSAGPAAAATLSAGSNVTITNGHNTVSIASSGGGGGLTWNVVTLTTATMASNNGFFTNNSGLVSLTMPATSAVGDTIAVSGFGAGGWKIIQLASQIIHLGSSATTTGITGSLASTNQYDSFLMVCVVANTTWNVVGAPQSSGLTVV